MKDREVQLQQLTTELEKAKGEGARRAKAKSTPEQSGYKDCCAIKRMTADRVPLCQARRNPSQLDAMKVELSKANEATEQAKAKIAELENVANSAKEDEAERTKLQSELDQANAEIDRLKTELEQNAGPPVSASPPVELPQ